MEKNNLVQINFICPICNQETLVNQEVFFDFNTISFYHITCIEENNKKELEKQKNIILTNNEENEKK